MVGAEQLFILLNDFLSAAAAFPT